MPYLRACRGERLAVPPVWLMRQAGRYLPEYMEIRSKHSFLEVCRSPELACEVTIQPIRRFGFDAAILFSDILIPLAPMGANISFGDDHGPRIDPPIRSSAEIEALREIDPHEKLDFVLKSIKMIRAELPSEVALIGFAGAPFTLATYLVEGGKPQPFAHIKSLMYSEPETFRNLLNKLGDMVTTYLKAMITAGANSVQLFDTWAGILSRHDFREVVLPVLKRVFAELSSSGVPMTYFVHDGAHLLRETAETGCSVAGLCWRCSITEARRVLGDGIAVQGNLDPTVLLGNEKAIRSAVRRVLDDAGGSGGFIFNLGHGILPTTPISSVEIMLDEIRGAPR